MIDANETTFRVRMDDLAIFARLQLHSHDIDPIYPVLRHIMAERQYSDEAMFWQTELYLAYYNLSSALTAFACMPSTDDLWSMPDWVAKLPTGVERRGLRHPIRMREHLGSYGSHVGDHALSWVRRFCMADETPRGFHVDFDRLWAGVQEIAYNGRWAAFKYADLLKHVLGWPLDFPDMRLHGSSGPLGGLNVCYAPLSPPTTNLTEMNERARHIRSELEARGVPLSWDQLETMLCDFHSMVEGHYYPGYDIDVMLTQVQKAREKGQLGERDHRAILAARRACIPREYLAEWTGHAASDAARARAYAESGQILGR